MNIDNQIETIELLVEVVNRPMTEVTDDYKLKAIGKIIDQVIMIQHIAKLERQMIATAREIV